MYQRNDVEYVTVRDAFGSNTAATLTTYILIVFMIFNSATVLLFVGSMYKRFLPDPFYLTLPLLMVLSVVNYIGIQSSKSITNLIAIVEVTLLVIIGLLAIQKWDLSLLTHTPSTPNNMRNFWLASFLALFLFSGYDAVVKLSEETVEPGWNVPSAVISSVVVVTIMYLLLGMAGTSLGIHKPLHERGEYSSPVRILYERLIDSSSGGIVSVLGFLILLNSAFIGILSASRFVYGLSKDGRLPSILDDVNARFKTPHNAVMAVFLAMSLALLIHHPEVCASMANMFFLVFMAIMMISVIILRYKKKDVPRPFKIPSGTLLMGIGVVICVCYIAFGTAHMSTIHRV